MSDMADDQVIADACERNLTVVGCSGVEDELQEDIAEVIQDFRAAGIKFWMLTGDQGATAKEIGFNCGVMSRDENQCKLIEIDTIDAEGLKAEMRTHADEMQK